MKDDAWPVLFERSVQQLRSRNVRIIHTRFSQPQVAFKIKLKLRTIYKRNCCECGFPKPDDGMFDGHVLFFKALEYIPTYGFTRECLEKRMFSQLKFIVRRDGTIQETNDFISRTMEACERVTRENLNNYSNHCEQFFQQSLNKRVSG
ncbi:hypothetical protein RF11_02114 [Thelohanellus kitauei]|uniref:Uncharacterized protein n=1 Tax=Thelohanellus kitauei TaxID=669202 RepID=A0A0C2JGM4_THEKT|nr:hypothetical protein RF11_02114 [Thelohanellus kitauei]